MLFLRVLEETFVLTIISLCSNANDVGDLKILNSKFCNTLKYELYSIYFDSSTN